jgi:hypothetical protein
MTSPACGWWAWAAPRSPPRPSSASIGCCTTPAAPRHHPTVGRRDRLDPRGHALPQRPTGAAVDPVDHAAGPRAASAGRLRVRHRAGERALHHRTRRARLVARQAGKPPEPPQVSAVAHGFQYLYRNPHRRGRRDLADPRSLDSLDATTTRSRPIMKMARRPMMLFTLATLRSSPVHGPVRPQMVDPPYRQRVQPVLRCLDVAGRVPDGRPAPDGLVAARVPWLGQAHHRRARRPARRRTAGPAARRLAVVASLPKHARSEQLGTMLETIRSQSPDRRAKLEQARD